MSHRRSMLGGKPNGLHLPLPRYSVPNLIVFKVQISSNDNVHLQFGVCQARIGWSVFVTVIKSKQYFISLTFPFLAETKLHVHGVNWAQEIRKALVYNLKLAKRD